MRPTPREAILLALFCGILIFQLFVPPFYGLADNGDFPKVLGRFSYGPPLEEVLPRFIYVQPYYEHSQRHHWVSPVWSSEILLARAAVALGGARMDIRMAGLVHGSILMAVFWVLLTAMRPLGAGQWVLGALAILVLTDVEYTSYLNSFYSDVPALLGFVAMCAAGAHLARSPSMTWLLVFHGAALLFATSKAQHGIHVWIPVVFALACVWCNRKLRAVGLLLGVILVAIGVCVAAASPLFYRGQAVFNTVFFRLARTVPDTPALFRHFRLEEQDKPYIGMHSFMDQSPMRDDAWAERFYVRTGGASSLLRWYWLHPESAWQAMRIAIKEEAVMPRPPNLSNYRREDGKPMGARAEAFSIWSSMRAWLFRIAPWHAPVWLAAAALYAAFLWKTPATRLQALALACLLLLAIAEFFVAALADVLETYRHLFLFHASTDASILTTVALRLR